MNGPLSTFAGNSDMELDPPAIEQALRDLWRGAVEETEGGRPVARVRVLNLIVYTEDEASADLADDVMSLLPEHHPCRAIVLRMYPQTHRRLRATISARCSITEEDRRTICSEQIAITAGENTRALVADAITPLLVADLPVVLWWTGRPRPADPIFRRLGQGRVDRVLVDGARFRDPTAGLLALSRWQAESHGDTTLSDMTWERLRPWRQLLAQTVDAPEARLHLPRIQDVTIAYEGTGAPPEEALLAAGWLMACFRWQPEDSRAAGQLTLRAQDHPVTVHFLPDGRDASDAPLAALTLRSADGVAFSVRAGDQPGLGICAVEGLGHAAIERTVPFVHRDPARLAVAAIGRPGRDPVFEASLAAAAEIAVLGATA
jgi:glucose-6-phosphate dehydrogenase assembly protein OpcA